MASRLDRTQEDVLDRLVARIEATVADLAEAEEDPDLALDSVTLDDEGSEDVHREADAEVPALPEAMVQGVGNASPPRRFSTPLTPCQKRERRNLPPASPGKTTTSSSPPSCPQRRQEYRRHRQHKTSRRCEIHEPRPNTGPGVPRDGSISDLTRLLRTPSARRCSPVGSCRSSRRSTRSVETTQRVK